MEKELIYLKFLHGCQINRPISDEFQENDSNVHFKVVPVAIVSHVENLNLILHLRSIELQ